MKFFPTPEIKGEKPFKCFVCAKKLIISIEGDFKMKLHCPRCDTFIIVITKQSLKSLQSQEAVQSA